MAYVQKLFNDNFLEYASYVIKERAIPHLDDGFAKRRAEHDHRQRANAQSPGRSQPYRLLWQPGRRDDRGISELFRGG